MGNCFSSADLLEVQNVVEILGRITSTLRDNISWMARGEVIEGKLTAFLETNHKLEQEQKAAIEKLIDVCQKINTAQYKSSNLVATVNGLASDTLKVMDCGADNRNIINKCLTSIKEIIIPELNATCDQLHEAENSIFGVQGALSSLRVWYENKISYDLHKESSSKIFQERVIKYSGGAAAVAAGVGYLLYALELFNPMVAGGIAVLDEASIGVYVESYTIESYTIESYNTIQIRTLYEEQIQRIREAHTNLQATIDHTKSLRLGLVTFVRNLVTKVLASETFGEHFLQEENDDPRRTLECTFKESLNKICEHCQEFENLKRQELMLRTDAVSQSLAEVPSSSTRS